MGIYVSRNEHSSLAGSACEEHRWIYLLSFAVLYGADGCKSIVLVPGILRAKTLLLLIKVGTEFVVWCFPFFPWVKEYLRGWITNTHERKGTSCCCLDCPVYEVSHYCNISVMLSDLVEVCWFWQWLVLCSTLCTTSVTLPCFLKL